MSTPGTVTTPEKQDSPLQTGSLPALVTPTVNRHNAPQAHLQCTSVGVAVSPSPPERERTVVHSKNPLDWSWVYAVSPYDGGDAIRAQTDMASVPWLASWESTERIN